MMGNPLLHEVAEPVSDPTAFDIRALADDLRDTLVALDANGIAAPQIGVLKRVIAYRLPAHRIPASSATEPVPVTVMVNPVIEPLGQTKRPMWERCLSIPGLYGRVPRYAEVRIRYQTLEGFSEARTAKGYHAALWQHECDHLDGILYTMRLEDFRAFGFVSEIVPQGEVYPYTAAEFDGA
jgi:peptide deformylase